MFSSQPPSRGRRFARLLRFSLSVMPGLVPGIHFRRRNRPDGDARNKSGHDVKGHDVKRRGVNRAGRRLRDVRGGDPLRKCHGMSCSVMRAGLRPGRSQGPHPPFGPWSRTPPPSRVRAHHARPPAPARARRRDRPPRPGCHDVSCFVMGARGGLPRFALFAPPPPFAPCPERGRVRQAREDPLADMAGSPFRRPGLACPREGGGSGAQP